MKVGEFRDLGADELRQREKDMDDQLFRLRIQKSMGQLEAAGKLRGLRRDIARLKTVLREKEMA
jgi:large subunit ribosomal protein L29